MTALLSWTLGVEPLGASLHTGPQHGVTWMVIGVTDTAGQHTGVSLSLWEVGVGFREGSPVESVRAAEWSCRMDSNSSTSGEGQDSIVGAGQRGSWALEKWQAGMQAAAGAGATWQKSDQDLGGQARGKGPLAEVPVFV